MGYLPTLAYIDTTLDASTTSASTGSIWLGPDCITRGAFHSEWNEDSGTLDATATYYGSADPRARPDHPDHSNAHWNDITSEMTGHTDPTTGAGDNSFAVDNLNYEFIKVDYARNSGSGRLRVYFAGRSG